MIVINALRTAKLPQAERFDKSEPLAKAPESTGIQVRSSGLFSADHKQPSTALRPLVAAKAAFEAIHAA